jgi:hypothetical protein
MKGMGMNNRVFRIGAFTLFIACVAAHGGSARLFGETGANVPPKEEVWMDMYLGATKAGYAHHVKENAVFKNRNVLGYKTEVFIKMSNIVAVRTIHSLEIDYVDDEHKPLGFVKVFKPSGTKERIIEGTVEEGELRLKIAEGCENETKTLEIPDNFLFDDVAFEILRSAGFRIGDSISFFTIDEDGTEFVPVTKAVTAKTGGTVEIRTDEGVERPFTIKTFVDPSGYVSKVEYVDLGMTMVKVEGKTPEADYPGLDMTAATLEADELLRNSIALRKLELKVIIDEENPGSIFLPDERQRIEMKGKNCILLIESLSPDTYQSAKLPLDVETRDRLESFLAPTDMIQSDNPVIQKEASEFSGDVTDMWALSKLISEKTRKLLTPSYEMGNASALEAIEAGKGDCSEHAVVFAAMARSLGIPVRICFGMVYLDFGLFVYHAWNEVYIGRWVPIDPVLAQDRVDATHIVLHKGNGDSSDFEFDFRVLRSMGRMKFKVRKHAYWKEDIH